MAVREMVLDVVGIASGLVGYVSGELPEGVVTMNNVPSRAEIILLRRSDLGIIQRQISAADGTYRFSAIPLGVEYDLIGRDPTGTWDDVIAGRVQPYAPPQITTAVLAFTVGNPATTQMAAQYGGEPLTWSADVVPPGLSLSASGLWGGMATVPGAYTVAITVTDTFGESGTRTYTVTVT